MSIRSSSYFGGTAVLWAFLAFLQIDVNVWRFQFSSLFVLGLTTCGAILGIVVGFVISQSRLRSIEQKWETAYSLSTILYILGSLFIFISVAIIIFPRVPLEILASLLMFVSPMPSAFFAVSAVAFSNWERKHGKKIFSSFWSSRVYVYPKTEQPPQR